MVIGKVLSRSERVFDRRDGTRAHLVSYDIGWLGGSLRVEHWDPPRLYAVGESVMLPVTLRWLKQGEHIRLFGTVREP